MQDQWCVTVMQLKLNCLNNLEVHFRWDESNPNAIARAKRIQEANGCEGIGLKDLSGASPNPPHVVLSNTLDNHKKYTLGSKHLIKITVEPL